MSHEKCGDAATAKSEEAPQPHEGHQRRSAQQGNGQQGHGQGQQHHHHHYYYYFGSAAAIPPGTPMPENAQPQFQSPSPPPTAAAPGAPHCAGTAAGQPNAQPMGSPDDRPMAASMGAPAPADPPPGQGPTHLPTGDSFIKGLLVGAGVSFLLTNETVQKNLIRTAVRLWSVAQGSAEEVKERFRDAEAEIKTGSTENS